MKILNPQELAQSRVQNKASPVAFRKLKLFNLPHSQAPVAHKINDTKANGTWLKDSNAGTNTQSSAIAVKTRCLSMKEIRLHPAAVARVLIRPAAQGYIICWGHCGVGLHNLNSHQLLLFGNDHFVYFRDMFVRYFLYIRFRSFLIIFRSSLIFN